MSKIEEIVKTRLFNEYEKQVKLLKDTLDNSIENFTNTYENLLLTLSQLELTDATLFDFFEKTNGNIRVVNIVNKFNNNDIYLQINGQGNLITKNITLEKDKIYKIILMAIEQKDDKL